MIDIRVIGEWFSVVSRYERGESFMGFGLSIVLIAAGAILRFAVDPTGSIGGTSVNWESSVTSS